MRPLALVALFAAGCGVRLVDPCAGVAGTCVALQVDAAPGATPLDTLAVQVAGAAYHASAGPVGDGKPLAFPVAVGVVLPPLPQSPLPLTVSVIGSEHGQPRAAGSVVVRVTSGQHATAHVQLEPSTGDVAGPDLGPPAATPDQAMPAGIVPDLALPPDTGGDPGSLVLQVVRTGNTTNSGAVIATGPLAIAPGGASCDADCTIHLPNQPASNAVTITASPDPTTTEPTVVTWTGCDSVQGNVCLVTVTGDEAHPTRVTVQLALRAFQWTLGSSGIDGASGSLSYTGGSCAADSSCTVTYRYGDSVSVTALPGAGSNAVTSDGVTLPWAFAGWRTGPCAGGNAPTCTTTVGSAQTVTGSFQPYNYMFVTSQTYTPGRFGTYDPQGANDGFRGADALCQQRADASLLPALRGKHYRAFLASNSPYLIARDRLVNGSTPARGWVRPDGRPFSDSLLGAAVTSQTFSFPLLDESGALVSGSFAVATGASGNGQPEDGGCNNWTSTSAPNSLGGDAGNGNHLFARAYTLGCNEDDWRLYCFGIDYSAPLSLPAPAPTPPFKRAFASLSSWRPGQGVADADARCQKDAVSNGLCATVAGCPFAAVMAPLNATAQSRFGNLDRPIYRVDNVRVASTAARFFAGLVEAALDRRPDGSYAGGYFHWTGGSGNGTVAGTCNDWRDGSTAATATIGQVSRVEMRALGASSLTFFGDSVGGCDLPRYLMCLEK